MLFLYSPYFYSQTYYSLYSSFLYCYWEVICQYNCSSLESYLSFLSDYLKYLLFVFIRHTFTVICVDMIVFLFIEFGSCRSVWIFGLVFFISSEKLYVFVYCPCPILSSPCRTLIGCYIRIFLGFHFS